MTKAGERMLKAAREARAFVKGEDVPGVVVHIPDELNVKALRKRLKLTQAAFAEQFAVDIATVRNWEQGRRAPTGAARMLLKVIAREPEAVRRALDIDA